MRGAILKVIKYIVGSILLISIVGFFCEIGFLVCGVLLFLKWDPSILPKRRRRRNKRQTEDRWNCYVGAEGEENEWSFKTRYR